MPPDNDARGWCVSAVLRPVRYLVGAASFLAPCGVDIIRPPGSATEPSVEWCRLTEPPLGFPRGEAVMTNNRLFGTDYLS